MSKPVRSIEEVWADHGGRCANCGTTERPHQARGLCKPCYYRLRDQGRRVNAPKDDTQDDDTGGDVLSESDAGTTSLDGGEGDGGPLLTRGERTPGTVGAPSPPPGSSDSPSSATPKSLRDRLFGKKDDRSTVTEVTGMRTVKEKKPSAPRGRRVSAADTISDVWAGAGSILQRSGTHRPSGTWMRFQAPYAGEMIDQALAGSIVDKMALQKIAKARGRFDLLGAVVAPPLILFAIERNPANAGVLLPALESSIRASLPQMVEGIKKVKAKEKITAEAAAALFADDPDFHEGDDPVRHIMDMIFSGWAPPEPAAPPPTEDATL